MGGQLSAPFPWVVEASQKLNGPRRSKGGTEGERERESQQERNTEIYWISREGKRPGGRRKSSSMEWKDLKRVY